MTGVDFVIPSLSVLDGYLDALRRGWSADNVRGAEAARDEIEAIRRDPAAFVATKADDRTAAGGAVTLPDGSTVPRLPCFSRWLWDGAFCGSIGLRWQPGTRDLPPHVLGHIGYSVVPWKRGRGYATKALMFMIDAARAEGPAPRRTHDRPGQRTVPEGHPRQLRRPSRALMRARAVRGEPRGPALPHCAVVARARVASMTPAASCRSAGRRVLVVPGSWRPGMRLIGR